MHFDGRGGISVLELLVYIPLFVISVLICIRHGFKRSSGWVFTLLLCLIRLIGACCQLATYNSPSQGLFEAVFILSSVGLSPLLLATLGLLLRCVDSVKGTGNSPFRAIHFRLLQTLITAGLILSIVGGTSSFSSNGTYTVKPLSRVAIILYIIAYAAEVLLAVHTLLLAQASQGERILLLGVTAALPLILVRLIYSALGVIANLHTFSVFNGSVAAYAIMAVVPEIMVVAGYLLAGWKSDVARPAQSGRPSYYSPDAPANYNPRIGERML
ncbi:MAG: hypothetical protein Q9191_002096 [Dirinaria sp. TL-2023a]